MQEFAYMNEVPRVVKFRGRRNNGGCQGQGGEENWAKGRTELRATV